MQWQDIIAMAQELAATPPSDRFHQIHLRGAVRSAYLAAYHALARSNADLLAGGSDAERSQPEWLRAYHALGGDYSDQRLQGDYSGYPEAVRAFADTFLELHHQRLLADEDISATFTAAEAQAWVERAAGHQRLPVHRPIAAQVLRPRDSAPTSGSPGTHGLTVGADCLQLLMTAARGTTAVPTNTLTSG